MNEIIKRIEALEATSYQSEVNLLDSIQRALRTRTLHIGAVSPTNTLAAALIALNSTTKGFLFSRMTTAQRDAIVNPTAGLVIYNTTTNKLNVYTTAWEAVTSA